MKYPKEQFDKLKSIISKIDEVIKVKDLNFSHLHFLCYQQVSIGQRHNEFLGLEVDESFELYPNNTNDNHIETAIKKALKELNIN